MVQQMGDFSLVLKDGGSGDRAAKAVVLQWIDLHKAVVVESHKWWFPRCSACCGCVSSFLSNVNAADSFFISTT